MNLQHLRYFSLACKYHNISRAAEECHMSQSSISSAIKALEEEFNTTLIKRQRTGFILTNAGEKFLALCNGLLTQSDTISSIMSEYNQSHKTIRLGVPPMTGAIILPDLLSYFQREHPEVKLSITEAGGIELMKMLTDSVLDFILMPESENLDASNFHEKKFAVFEEVCCVSNKSPLLKNSLLTVSDLKDFPIVMFSDSFYHHDIIQQLLKSAGFEPYVIHKTTQLSTMEQLISKNVAVGILFKERAEQLDDVCWIPLSPKVSTSISLVWRKDMYITKDMDILCKYCEKM